MLRNFKVLKLAGITLLFLTGLYRPVLAQAPTAAIDANDTIVCVGNSISFTDMSVPGGAVITTWAWTFGDGGTSASQNPSYAYTNGGNYTVTLIVTDANGNKDTATQAIFVLLAQAVNNTVRICSPQSSTTIYAIDPGISGVSTAWFTASSAVIATPGNDTTVISNLVSGTYIFFWVVTDGTCSDADQVTVIVDQPVTTNAGPDQQVCSTPGTATMAGSSPNPGTGVWSTTSTATIANPSNRNTTISGLTSAGTYTFVWTVTNGSCVNRDTMNIVVSSPIASAAGSDQQICSSPGTATLTGSSPSPGTGLWTTTGSATIATPSSSSTAVSGLTSAGTYTFIWSVTNGACITRDTVLIVVTAPVTANAGTDIQVCTSTASATLNGSNPSPGTGLWTALNGGVITTPSSSNSTVTGLGVAGTYNFVWTITNGPCVTRDTVAIIVRDPITASAGADQQFCATSTATLTGNSPSPGTGLWTTTGSATIASPSSATTAVSNLAYGTNTFIYSITYGACVTRDTMIVRRDSLVTANAGPDQQICESSGTITMAANSATPGTGIWTKLNGGTITTPSSPTTTITGLTAGSHQFVWTITNGTCVSRDTMRVIVNFQIPSNAGLDQSVCQGSTTSLSGNNPTPATGLWTTTSSASITTPSSPTSAVTGLTNAGVYTFIWTVTNGACVLRDTARITVDSLIVSNAGPDQNLCALTVATLAANSPASGSGTWTSLGTAIVATPSSATSGVTGLAYGNNNFVWTITNGSCSSKDTIRIRVDSVVTANAGPDQSICSSPGTAIMAASTPSAGSGLWTTSSSATIASPSSPTSAISGLTTAGTYTFIWSVTNGVCISRDTVSITVSTAVTANAGPDQSLCNVTSTSLAGNSAAPGSGTWTTSSSAVITTPSSPTSTVTGLHAGTYNFIWTIVNGACVSRDTVRIIVDTLITSNAGPDQQVCSGNAVLLSGNTPTQGTGLWTALSGGTITTPTSASSAVTGLTTAGTYSFVWTVTNGTCVSRDTVQITISQLVVSNAGADQSLCNTTSATLAGNIATPGTGTWTTTSTAVITTPSNPASTVTGLLAGTYNFVWTIVNGACTSRDTIRITVDTLIVSNAGPDQQVCSGSTVVLSANAPTQGSGLWTALNGGTFSNATSPSASVSGLVNSGNYSFVWTVSNGACISRDTMVITIDSNIVAYAGADQSLCNVTTTALTGNGVAHGSGTWTTTSSAVIVSANNPLSTVTGLLAGTYSFVWTVINGTCTSSDTVNITIDTLITADAGPDQQVCEGSTVLLAANTPTQGSGLWTALSGGIISNSTSPSASISGLTSAGTYSFVWTISNGSCTAADTMSIVVDQFIVADAGTDQQLCNQTTTTLAGNAAAPGIGTWSTTSSATIANPADENAAVSDLITGVYSFVWTVTNGTCISSDTMEVQNDTLEIALAGPDQTVCAGSTVTLAANTPLLGIGVWSDLNGGVITNSASENSTVTGLDFSGTYSFVWTIISGVCTSSDTVTINVDSLIVSNAGTDQSVCNVFTATLGANTPAIGSGIWTTSGAATFVLDTDPATDVNNLAFGPNELIWTITNNTCTSADTILVTVDSVVTANAGTDQQICSGSVMTMSANTPSVGTGTWSALNGGVIANANSEVTTVSGLDYSGTYSFVWSITNGACVSTDTMLVIVDSLDAAFAGADQSLCETQTTTNLAANTPVLGTGTWSSTSGAVIDNVNDPNTLISGLVPGAYDFIWTIVNNTCTSSDTITVLVSSNATTSSAGPDQQACASAIITLSANIPVVGTGLWTSLGAAVVDNPSLENSTVSNLQVGVNDFVWTITNGACISTDTVSITIFPLPLADAGADQYVTSGTVVTIGGFPAGSGGTGPYTYLWTPGTDLDDSTIANPTVTIFNTSTFILLVTDSLGCSGMDTVTIWVNNPPDAQDDSLTTAEDTAIVFNVLINDTDPENNIDTNSVGVLQGPFHGSILIGTGGQITYTPDPNYYGPDSIYYTVCDSGIPVFCDSAWVIFNITPVNDAPVAIDDFGTTPEDTCIQISLLANDSDVENMIDLNTLVILGGPSNGTYTLDPLTGILTYCPDSNFTGLDTLIYAICDSGFPLPGLCDTALVVITVVSSNDPPVALSDTTTNCSGDAIFATVLGNDYDPEGDTLSLSILVQPLNGSASISPTQEIIYASNAGSFGWDSLQYVVCDQQTPAACDTAWLYIWVNPLPQATSVIDHVSCYGDSSGAIDITLVPAGTYIYSWDNGSTDEDIDSLFAGIYTLSVIDSNGCVLFVSDTVNSPAAALSAITIRQPVLCYGDSTGAIDLQVTGGTSPYTYQWSNTSIDEDQDSLLAGSYVVTVTDTNGCVITINDTIVSPLAPLSGILTSTDILCAGDSTGAMNVVVTGGTPGYTYSWNNGSTADTLTGLVAGIYTVVVTDTNGCVWTLGDTLSDLYAPIVLSPVVVDPHCLSGISGSILVNATGGLAPLNYNWSTGDTINYLDSLAVGVYLLTVTDSNGCNLTASYDLKDTSAIVISLTGSDTFCEGDSVILNVASYSNVSYQWIKDGIVLAGDTTTSLIVMQSGDYEITTTSVCGPFNDGPVTITVNTLPVVSAGTDADITCDSTLILSAVGASSYSWTPAGFCTTPDQAITSVDSLRYTTSFIVIGTDANGCSSSDTVLVNVTCDTLSVPSGFSPNGDGINDFFEINNLDEFPNANLKVFNRWGTLVFEMDKYDNTWSGLSNSDLIRVGEELPDGTYYYVLDLKNGEKALQGYVILRR